jgi:hypothetical protein
MGTGRVKLESLITFKGTPVTGDLR